MRLPKFSRSGLLILLAIIGPGIVTAAVDNDAGGIATYSVAGAHFGYAFLWLIAPIAVLLIIMQELSARLGIVSGKGLAELIRENFGLKFTFYLMIVLIFTNFANSIAEFAGIAASAEIFGISRYIAVPFCAVFVWLMIFRGTYSSVEKAFLGMTVFYITYIIAGVIVNPDWGQIAVGFVTPQVSLSPDYTLILVALIGTTIAPWMQFYLQAAIVEKGIKNRHLNYSRFDVVLGSIVTVAVMLFIIICCAAVLYPNHVLVETAEDAAKALAPLAGTYASLLFAFGLFMASLFAAAILPLSTAYTVCEGLGWDSGVNKKFREAPQFYITFTLMIIISAALILVPNMPLISVMVVSQALNGLLLPVILVVMLLLANKEEIVHEYKNGRISNALAVICTILVSIAALALVASVLLGVIF